MRKTLSFIFILLVAIIFALIFPAFSQAPVFAEENKECSFRAYGDSISAGYGLEDYENYLNGTHEVTNESYPQYFSKPYLNCFGGNLKAYGVSGDKSSDLVEDIEGYINKSATDFDDFYNTDYFTLCIGANNVLSPAIDNISNYLTGAITDDEYRNILQTGVNQFEQDYKNSILPCFTQNKNSKVYVMTIYNPYKYTNLTDVKVASNNILLNSSILVSLGVLNIDLQNMLSITIEYLQKINNIIRNSANENVIVVDIYNMFEKFSRHEYLEYINSDISKIEITSLEDVENLASYFIQYCDPHPTSKGHEVIAKKHIEKLCFLQFEMKTNLDEIKNDDNFVEFNVKQLGGGESLKLVKNVKSESIIKNNIKVDKNDNYEGVSSFKIKAKHLIGEGTIHLQSYSDNVVTAKSNEINFSYKSKGNAPNNTTFIVVSVVALVIFVFVGTYANFRKKKYH